MNHQELTQNIDKATRWPTPYTGRHVTTQGPITHTRTIKGTEGLEVWGTADFQSEIHLSTTYYYQLA